MRRRGLLFGAAIAVGVLLIAELAVRAVRFEGARAFVERELGELLGLEVEIAGSFQLELLPRPQLEATGTARYFWGQLASRKSRNGNGNTPQPPLGRLWAGSLF